MHITSPRHPNWIFTYSVCVCTSFYCPVQKMQVLSYKTTQARQILSCLNDVYVLTGQLMSVITSTFHDFLPSIVRIVLQPDFKHTPCVANKTTSSILSLLKEMQMSTRHFTLSGGQTLSPLVRLVRLDYHCTRSLATRQATKFLSLLNEMQKSTRQFTLSGGQALSPLVRLVRLDDNCTGRLANKTSDKISESP